MLHLCFLVMTNLKERYYKVVYSNLPTISMLNAIY